MRSNEVNCRDVPGFGDVEEVLDGPFDCSDVGSRRCCYAQQNVGNLKPGSGLLSCFGDMEEPVDGSHGF